MDKNDDILIGLADKTGALLMINQKERELLRTILSMTVRSLSAKDWITKKLGPEYMKIAEQLLKSMGGETA
ncbi:MAG: hypothetical protein JW836_04890 [Deltaproteobacteria bacterium]|nr:hypothetical protein [Deltaproteobacteria bacterium]